MTPDYRPPASSDRTAGSKSSLTSRASEKRQQARDAEKAWRIIRRLVLERDDYRCRACGSKDSIDVHHVQFRSAGGSSTDPKNLVALCRICHQDLHLYKLAIVSQGRLGANGTLTFRRVVK